MEKQSIISNSIYNVLYRGLTVVFPLLTSIYVSHVLLADGVGRVSYANTVSGYFALLAALGIPNYGIKTIAQNNDGILQRSKAFWELFLINAISTTLCACSYYLLVNNIDYFSDLKLLFNISGLSIVLNYFNVDWFYQGLENYKYIAIRGTIVKVLSFVSIIFFVKTKDDYLTYALILCVATAGNYIINFINLKKYVIFNFCALNLKKHVKSILIIAASTIATEVYTMLDTVMIEYFHGEYYVGLYSNSTRLVRVIYSIGIALVATFFPRLSNYIKNKMWDKSNQLLNYGILLVLIYSLPCVFGILILSSDIVVTLFGISFAEADQTLRILCILIPVFSFAYLLGHVYLISLGKEKYILTATTIGAISNVVLNLLLIPKFKHNGAAIASVCSESIVTYFLLKSSRQYYRLKIDKMDLLSIVKALFIMVCVTVTFSMILEDSIIRIVFIVPLAAFVYVFSLFKSGNSIIGVVKTKIKR